MTHFSTPLDVDLQVPPAASSKCSAKDAVRNGGARLYTKYPGGNEEKVSFTVSLYTTNFKAETEGTRK